MWAGCGCQTGGAAWRWSVPSAAQGKWLCGVKSLGQEMVLWCLVVPVSRLFSTENTRPSPSSSRPSCSTGVGVTVKREAA